MWPGYRVHLIKPPVHKYCYLPRSPVRRARTHIPPASPQAAHGNYVLSFDEFLAIGAPDLASDILPEAEAEGDAALDARIAAIDPRHCSTLIYTSGTTGNPKGVMISHDSMNFICKSAMESTEMHQGTTPWHSISYLPMSHIAAQVTVICLATCRPTYHSTCHHPTCYRAAGGGYFGGGNFRGQNFVFQIGCRNFLPEFFAQSGPFLAPCVGS